MTVEEHLFAQNDSGDFERLRIVSVMDCLAQEMPFDKLTVTAICDQAKISRTTFYRLFDDKFAAPNWYVHLVSRIGHVECGRTLSWHDASVITLSGLSMMKNLLMSTKVCSGYDSSENTGMRLRESSLTETVVQRTGCRPDSELAFQIKFFARAEVPLVREWYQDSDSVCVKDMAHAVESCVPQRLHDLIALPDNPKKGTPLTYPRLMAML